MIYWLSSSNSVETFLRPIYGLDHIRFIYALSLCALRVALCRLAFLLLTIVLDREYIFICLSSLPFSPTCWSGAWWSTHPTQIGPDRTRIWPWIGYGWSMCRMRTTVQVRFVFSRECCYLDCTFQAKTGIKICGFKNTK